MRTDAELLADDFGAFYERHGWTPHGGAGSPTSRA